MSGTPFSNKQIQSMIAEDQNNIAQCHSTARHLTVATQPLNISCSELNSTTRKNDTEF